METPGRPDAIEDFPIAPKTRPNLPWLISASVILAALFWSIWVGSRWAVYRSGALRFEEERRSLEIETRRDEARLRRIPADDPSARSALESAIEGRRQALIRSTVLADRYRKSMRHPWSRADLDRPMPSVFP